MTRSYKSINHYSEIPSEWTPAKNKHKHRFIQPRACDKDSERRSDCKARWQNVEKLRFYFCSGTEF